MSFFNEILESIGSDKAPAPPIHPKPTVSTNSNRSTTESSKPVAALGIQSTITQQNGIKRKAGEMSQDGNSRADKPTRAPVPVTKARPAATQINGSSKAVTAPNGTSRPSATVPKVPPPKNFQEILARARQVQAERGQSQVGIIKHQAVSKEKISRLAERKREEEEKQKGRDMKSRLGPRPGSSGRIEKRRSASPTKPHDRQHTIKDAKTGTSATHPENYRGTMGLNSSKAKGSASTMNRPGARRARSSRYDDYLGTDEEDEGEMLEEDELEDDASDASSDMEAGAFDIDEEENRALRVAKEDDAREAELEARLKREKEERRKKLQAMANKSVRKY